MKVISLDDKIENMIMSSVKKMDTGSYLALSLLQSRASCHRPRRRSTRLRIW